MIIGIILKDEFCDLRCFPIQLNSDTKIYTETSSNIIGNTPPPTFYSSLSEELLPSISS